MFCSLLFDLPVRWFWLESHLSAVSNLHHVKNTLSSEISTAFPEKLKKIQVHQRKWRCVWLDTLVSWVKEHIMGWRLTLSCFIFSAFFLSPFMNHKIMSFVTQNRKVSLYFIKFWIFFPKSHNPINTHDLTPDIFIFKPGVYILFITFDLLILDCLFVLVQSILCCFGAYDWCVWDCFPVSGIIGFIYPYHVHCLSCMRSDIGRSE